MIKTFKTWLCAKLAECFNLHRTAEEEEFLEDLAELREIAEEFQQAAKALSKYKGVEGFIRVTDVSCGRGPVSYCFLGSIEIDLTDIKMTRTVAQ